MLKKNSTLKMLIFEAGITQKDICKRTGLSEAILSLAINGRYILDTVYLKMPIVSGIVYKTSVSRWTRTLGTLISAGVPILEAINITADTAGNEVYSRMLRKVQNSIRQGDTFANPLRKSKTTDGLVVNMIDVGEETGEMDKMLAQGAELLTCANLDTRGFAYFRTSEGGVVIEIRCR